MHALSPKLAGKRCIRVRRREAGSCRCTSVPRSSIYELNSLCCPWACRFSRQLVNCQGNHDSRACVISRFPLSQYPPNKSVTGYRQCFIAARVMRTGAHYRHRHGQAHLPSPPGGAAWHATAVPTPICTREASFDRPRPEIATRVLAPLTGCRNGSESFQQTRIEVGLEIVFWQTVQLTVQ